MRAAWLIVGWLVLAGCTSKVTGSLKLDGQEFKITECRSGAAFSFSGIQVADAAGKRIRLFQRVDGGVNAAVFAPGQAKGEGLEVDCGSLDVHTQNSRINNIRNVEGSAVLKCTGNGHSLEGTISFENCH